MSLDTPAPDHSDHTDHGRQAGRPGGAADDGFAVDVRREGPATVLSVSGDVDVASAPAFREAVAEVLDAGPSDLVVDLDRVSFLDSTGLGVLVATHRRVTSEGGSLAVVCNNPTCMLVIHVAGVNQVMRFYDSVEAAVADVEGTDTSR